MVKEMVKAMLVVISGDCHVDCFVIVVVISRAALRGKQADFQHCCLIAELKLCSCEKVPRSGRNL